MKRSCIFISEKAVTSKKKIKHKPETSSGGEKKSGTTRLGGGGHMHMKNTPVCVIGSFLSFFFFFYIFDSEPRNAQTIPIKTLFVIISHFSPLQPVIITSELLLTLICIRRCRECGGVGVGGGERSGICKQSKKERDRHLTGDRLINTCAGS